MAEKFRPVARGITRIRRSSGIRAAWGGAPVRGDGQARGGRGDCQKILREVWRRGAGLCIAGAEDRGGD